MTTMIDFEKTIANAQKRAEEVNAMRHGKPVSEDSVAEKIAQLAEAGYVPTAETVSIVRHYLSGRGIMLSGAAGTGKTFLMTLLCGKGPIQHAERDINVWGLTGISEWYNWRDGREVVVDDLGCEVETSSYGVRVDLLKLVLEHRYAAQRGRTHITTNLTSDGIRARYGERILDRLLEMCVVVRMTGESWRRTNTKGEARGARQEETHE